MPKLNSFFEKENKVEQLLTKKMHPQLISYKKLRESKFQYREISEEDVTELAALIELDGEVLQPLLVRKTGGDSYEILAGHKRFRACRYLAEERKLEQFALIPCYVKQLTDVQAEFAVYSTNGYSKKTDYQIMREVEGMSRLLKENPEAFPEAASGRLVEKLSKIMDMSKTVIQEYKTISKNLGNEAMEKFKKNEITKEAAKTLASVPVEEQKKIIDSGFTETKDIKKAAKVIRNPSMSEIRFAFKTMYNRTLYTPDFIRNYSSLEECFKEHEGRTHAGHHEYRLDYNCSLRGIAINNRKEITWHEFVSAAIEMGLYNPDEVYMNNKNEDSKAAPAKCTTGFNPYGNCVCCGKDNIRCCSECKDDCNGRCGWYSTPKNTNEQLPGQDNIYNHPEYLPDKDIENEKSDVTESVTLNNNKVKNYHNTDNLTGVKAIGKCPHCNSPLALLTNKKFCGNCGKPIVWN